MDEKLVVEITAEISKLKTELDKAKKDIEKFSESGEKKLGNFNEAMEKVGAGANKALKIATGALAAAAAALVGCAAATEEYRANQAKLETAFTVAGASAQTATETYNNLYRVLGDDGQATEAAAHLAQLTQNEKELSEWTTICQGVYATFGDSLPIEGLTEAANETAKVGTVTGGLADALNWAGVSEDEFNEKLAACNDEAEREKLIRETLTGIYDDAAATYEETAADVIAQNEAQAKLTDTMARLGEAVAPVLTMLTELGATVMEQLAPSIEEFMSTHGETLKQLFTDLGEAIGVVIGFIVDNIETIGLVAGVILAIVAAINLYNAAMAIYNVLMAPVNLTILAIVAAIAALVAIIVIVIKYWDEIKNACLVAWDAIKNACQVAIDWISGLFNSIIDFVKDNWQGLLLLLVNPFAGAFKLLYDNCEGFRNFIDGIVQSIGEFFSNLWQGLKDGAKNAWEGVKNAFSKVTSWFKDTFQKAWQGVKDVFSAGGKVFSGIKEGIEKVFKTVVNGIISGINKVVAVPFNAINSMLNRLRNISIAGISPFSWLPTLSVPQIPQLAQGGVVDSATLAVIGERGKEMIMPLENNLGYLDKLAEMLSARMGGNGATKLVLQVDKKALGEVSIDSINAITRQKGTLALNIV